MIKQVYDLILRISREHKLINSFKYEMLSKAAGTGEDTTPLVFLEMPLYFGSVNIQDGTIPVTFNIDIILNPQALENFDVEIHHFVKVFPVEYFNALKAMKEAQ